MEDTTECDGLNYMNLIKFDDKLDFAKFMEILSQASKDIFALVSKYVQMQGIKIYEKEITITDSLWSVAMILVIVMVLGPHIYCAVFSLKLNNNGNTNCHKGHDYPCNCNKTTCLEQGKEDCVHCGICENENCKHFYLDVE